MSVHYSFILYANSVCFSFLKKKRNDEENVKTLKTSPKWQVYSEKALSLDVQWKARSVQHAWAYAPRRVCVTERNTGWLHRRPWPSEVRPSDTLEQWPRYPAVLSTDSRLFFRPGVTGRALACMGRCLTAILRLLLLHLSLNNTLHSPEEYKKIVLLKV